MKSNRASVVLLLVTISCMLLGGTAAIAASAEAQADQAVAVSKSWMNQIDSGKYDDSYSFGCDAMREKIPQDRWVEVLKALRKPWGPVVSRQQLSHIYKPNGAFGLNGECMVITYNTAFKNLDTATEIVVLKWEDGKWRGAGYTAGRTPDPNAEAAPAPQNTTETHTQNHVRPTPQ